MNNSKQLKVYSEEGDLNSLKQKSSLLLLNSMHNITSRQQEMILLILKECCQKFGVIKRNFQHTSTSKPWEYRSPEERFRSNVHYETPMESKPKSFHDKMYFCFKQTKHKLDLDLNFIQTLIKETAQELSVFRTYNTMERAILAFQREETDDYNILQADEKQVNTNLHKCIKDLDVKLKKFRHEKFLLWDADKRETNKLKMEFLLKKEYIRKKYESQLDALQYKQNKDMENLNDIIKDKKDKIANDTRVHIAIEKYCNLIIEELEEEISQLRNKLDIDIELYQQNILYMRNEFENLTKTNEELKIEYARRTQAIKDYLEHKRIVEIENNERQKQIEIEEIEQQARLEDAASRKRARRKQRNKKRRRA